MDTRPFFRGSVWPGDEASMADSLRILYAVLYHGAWVDQRELASQYVTGFCENPALHAFSRNFQFLPIYISITI